MNQERAIHEADRKMRAELEAITDPALRAECLRAFDSLNTLLQQGRDQSSDPNDDEERMLRKQEQHELWLGTEAADYLFENGRGE